MTSVSFPADPSHVTELVSQTSYAINRNFKQNDKMRQYPLLFEELALKLIASAEPGAEITVSITRKLYRTSVQFRCPGSIVSLRQESEYDFGGQILSEFRDYLNQSYANGTNIITFSSPMSSVDVVIPGVCAIGLALLATTLLHVFAKPEQIQCLLDDLIDPVVQVFIHFMQAFSTPTAFLSLAALVISLRLAVTENEKVSTLFLRYLGTSVLAIGISFLVFAVYSQIGFSAYRTNVYGISKNFVETELSKFLKLSVSDNLIIPFLNSNPIPMLLLALLVGFAASTYFGRNGDKVRHAILATSGFFAHTLNLIFGFLPFFLFFAVLSNCLEYGTAYAKSVLLCIAGFFPPAVLLLISYAVLLRCSGVSLRRFFRAYRDIILANFRIGSNLQALPYNKRALSRKVQLPSRTLTNILRFGAAFNMDGNCLAVTQGILYVIFCGGISLSIPKYLALGLIILLLSVGIPNQPGSYMLAMVILFSFMGVSDRTCESLLIIELCLGRCYSFLNSLGDIVMVAIYDFQYQKETVPSPS